MMFTQSAILGVGARRVTLFEDSFSLNSINTDKWDVTNPSDGVDIAATDQTVRFTANPASPVASSNTNNLQTALSFNADIVVFRVTMAKNANSINQVFGFKCVNAADSYLTARAAILIRDPTTNTILIRVTNGASTEYEFSSAIVLPGGTRNAFKIVVNTSTNDIYFYHLDSNVWTQIGVTHNYDLGGALKLSLNANSSGSDTGTPYCFFDTIYITDDDFTTTVPSP